MAVSKLKKIKEYLLDLIFPIECLGCQKDNFYLCPECLKTIRLVDYFTCPNCRRPSQNGSTCPSCRRRTSLAGLIYAFDYNQPLFRKAWLTVKYQLITDLIYPLTEKLIVLLEQSNFLNNYYPDLIIPIPLHRRKLAKRGFNQSEIIAQILGQKFNWPLITKVLKRIKFTRSQTDLPKQARWLNVEKAFMVAEPEKIKNKNIILVDDVCTTGATLESAAKILKQGGAKSVWAITLARGKN